MTLSNNPRSHSEATDFTAGSIVFERFRILGEIASGAKGRVYKAQDTLLNTTVALKVLLLDHKNDRDLVRFQSEARLASKMKHPGIATIFDFGIFGNTPFLSMEFVEGESLGAYLERHHTISILELCEIFLQVCAAIDHAHAAGIVHRDIKPENIVISRNDDGTVKAKILDFGVAKNLDIVEEQGGKLTPTGNLVGSPNYMSPEQCRGSDDLTTKSDNYSLGCLMWTCLAGKPPFDSSVAMEVLAMHANVQPEKILAVVDVPEKLATLIDGLLSKKPNDRPDLKATVIPVLEELREELSLTFRDPAEENEARTTDGAKNERKFIDYVSNRKFYVLFGLTMLSIAGVWVYQTRTRSSENLAAIATPKPTDVGLQTEIMASRNIDQLLELVRQGKESKVTMSFVYEEKNLEKCAGMPALRKLELSDTPVSDMQTKHLARIPNLDSLYMNRTQVATLDGFGDLKKVKTLELKNTQITNSSLQNIAKMKSLKRLSINNTDIGDDGIKFLTPMKRLEELELSNTKITSKSAEYIKQLPHLRVLRVANTHLDESGIRAILMMPSLQFITLDECKAVDAKLLETLKQDFPTVSFANGETLAGRLYAECEKSRTKGDYQSAYEKMHKIIDLTEKRFGADSPVVTALYVQLAVICVNLEKNAELDQAYAKISRYADPGQRRIWQIGVLDSQASMARSRGDSKKWIAVNEKSVKLQDQCTGVYSDPAIIRVITLGDSYKQAHEFPKAIRTFDAAAARLKSRKNPTQELVLTCQVQRADCFRMFKKNAAATLIYKKVIQDLESNPNLSASNKVLLFGTYAGLGALEADEGNTLAALKTTDKMLALQKTAKMPPEHEATLYYQRGAYLQTLGRVEESKICFDRYESIKAKLSKKGK